MDQRSDLGEADPDAAVLESETVYQGMSIAPAENEDAYPGAYMDGDTPDNDDAVDPEIEAQRQRIERTRAQMGSTINAIEERLSPSRLAQEAKTAVKDATVGTAQQVASDISGSASEVGGSIVDTIRANPIPAALAGVGIGWLIMSMRNNGNNEQAQPNSQRYSYHGHNMYPTHRAGNPEQGGLSSVVGSAQDMAGSVAQTAQNTAGQVAGSVQDTAGQVAGEVQDTASQVTGTLGAAAGTAADSLNQVTNQAQYGIQRAESQMERWMRERPLAVTAGAFAVGLAVGLAIPETPIEDQWMGEYRQDLTQQAQQVVQETAPKVGAVAQETVNAAKSAAQSAASEQGLPTPGSKSGSKASSRSSKTSRGTGESGAGS
jgi:hypothetical protein